MELTRRDALRVGGAGVVAAATGSLGRLMAQDSRPRPNILWVSCEDISPHLGCYGYERARTTNLDRLASEGTRYTHAFTVHGVCAPSRSGIITGMYPSTIGTTYMRCRAQLPEHIRCFPEYLREAGYYCSNNSKTDYQFHPPESAWDESSNKAHWNKGPDGQPFFSVFNLGMTHESQYRTRGEEYEKKIRRLTPEDRQDPDALTTVPPYYADTPETRLDWAHYYELVTVMDYRAGEILAELEESGLADDTIVFFWSDHGVGLPRAKRNLYDSGTRVPLMARIPEKYRVGGQGEPDSVDNQLINLIDLGPTILNLSGVAVPEHMQGQPFLGPDLPTPREYIFGARDRIDERYDCVRTVRDRRYRYIRNYESYRPHYPWISYAERTPTRKELRRMRHKPELPDVAKQFTMPWRSAEELYDTEADPHEIRNLAQPREYAHPYAAPDLVDSPEHTSALKRLRRVHEKWMRDTRDLGLIPEALVVERERELGSRYEILRQPGAKGSMKRLLGTMEAGEAGRAARLQKALDDPDPAVRYWAAMWLGRHVGATVEEGLEEALRDESPIVRVAAARWQLRTGDDGRRLGLEALAGLLREAENEYVRLAAANEIDDYVALLQMTLSSGPPRWYLERHNVCDTLVEALEAAKEEDKSNYVKRVVERTLELLDAEA